MVHRLVRSPLVLMSDMSSHSDAQSKLTHCLILLLALPPPDALSLSIYVCMNVSLHVCA